MTRNIVCGVLLVAAAAWWLVPAERSQAVEWAWSAPPTLPRPYPHPALQLRELEPATSGVWVSPFLDLGGASRIVGLEWTGERSGVLPYLRSAHRTRSFRITEPQPWDVDTLRWARWPGEYRSRRFLQLATVGDSPALPPPMLRLRYSTRRPALGALALLGLCSAILSWPLWRPRLPTIGLHRVAALGLALLVALTTARLWSRSWIDPDEALVVNAMREVVKGSWALQEFRYPQALAYLNALMVTGLSLTRPLVGQVTYHDPVSNQLFMDGVPLSGRLFFGRGQNVFSPDIYPDLFFEESLGVVRKAYALIGALLVLFVGLTARAFVGPRAALWAALCIAVQPLLHGQAAHILPNIASAVVGLVVVFFLGKRLDGGARLFLASVLVGFAASFKYSPALVLVFLPLVWFDRPTTSSTLSLTIAVLGLPLGFLLGCPSALVYPRAFVTYFAREAQIYGVVGHGWASSDDPWPAIRHNLSLGSPYWGNVMIAGLALLGALAAVGRAASGRIREAWLLLAPPVLSLVFLASFFIQFGRNYLPFLAFACVLAGMGADLLLDSVRQAWPSRPFWPKAVGALGVLVALSVGRRCFFGTGIFGDPQNARVQAIDWVNAHAPLGSQIVLVEPDVGALDGVTVDARRFRVRRLSGDADLGDERFDFAIRSGTEDATVGAERWGFDGPGSFGLPTRYFVIRAPEAP